MKIFISTSARIPAPKTSPRKTAALEKARQEKHEEQQKKLGRFAKRLSAMSDQEFKVIEFRHIGMLTGAVVAVGLSDNKNKEYQFQPDGSTFSVLAVPRFLKTNGHEGFPVSRTKFTLDESGLKSALSLVKRTMAKNK